MNKNSQTTPKTKHRFIRLNEVLSRTGYGRTSIYRKMEDGSFPSSVKLDGRPPKNPEAFDSRAVAWIEDEVEQWIDSRIEGRDSVSTDVPPRQNIVR